MRIGIWVPVHKGKGITRTVVDYTLIDREDFKFYNDYWWFLLKGNNGYKYVIGYDISGDTVFLHHYFVGTRNEVDHINHVTMDNRRENLRVASHSQNMANVNKRKSATTSKYKGVNWYKPYGNWRARISTKHIGYYATEEEAALAYNKAALEAWGEFAYLNKVEEIKI